MIIRPLFLTMLLLSTSSYACQVPQTTTLDPFFFNTNNLRDYQKTADHLIKQYGAELITFKTGDNLTLHGTWIPRKQASTNSENKKSYTMIVAAGFLPGRQWGMSTLVTLLPQCNILLYDARGHGDSEGRFLTKLKRYGKREYKDVIAALDYAQNKSTDPVVMYGLCAGGFHILRALEILQEQKQLADYSVEKIIIDSGFTKCTDVINAGQYHFREKVFTPQIRRWFFPNIQDKKVVQEKLLAKIILNYVGSPLVTLLTSFVKSGLNEHEEKTRIDTKIKSLQHIPILAIHANDDQYAPAENITKLITEHANKNNTSYLLSKSSHGDNFFKHPEYCQKAFTEFLNKE